ncbi:Ankyrin-3 [Cladobotryum mycophilum]|uniref:Ankyrin-3 n=1 Tax=Cladobotryum mycophilum TaxID=491253 RepID=A0ABR0SIG9_9HYPO
MSIVTSPQLLVLQVAQSGQIQKLDKLLGDDRLRIAVKDEEGLTALHWAILNGHKHVVHCFLEEYDADIEAASEDGSRPLFLAVAKGQAEIVQLLVSSGASIDSRNEVNGITALHKACEIEHIHIARFLLENGSLVDERRRDDGYTPLFIAVRVNNVAGDHNAILQLLRSRRVLFKGPKIHGMEAEPESSPIRKHRLPGPDEKDQLLACGGFEATIIKFLIEDRENRYHHQPTSIFELLYEDIISITGPPSQPGAQAFTWYHLPANNMIWVEVLINRLIQEKLSGGFMLDTKLKSDLGLSNTFEGKGQLQKSSPFFNGHCAGKLNHDTRFTWNPSSNEHMVAFVVYKNYETMAKIMNNLKDKVKERKKPKVPWQFFTVHMPTPATKGPASGISSQQDVAKESEPLFKSEPIQLSKTSTLQEISKDDQSNTAKSRSPGSTASGKSHTSQDDKVSLQMDLHMTDAEIETPPQMMSENTKERKKNHRIKNLKCSNQ